MATYHEFSVYGVQYSVHEKRGAGPDHPKTMRVEYITERGRYMQFICPEHTGYARQRAERWWRAMCRTGAPLPDTAEEAVALAQAGALWAPLTIVVAREKGRYPEILDVFPDTADTAVHGKENQS